MVVQVLSVKMKRKNRMRRKQESNYDVNVSLFSIFYNFVNVVVWVRVVSTSSYIWMLSYQRVIPCWRKCIIQGRLWGFKSPSQDFVDLFLPSVDADVNLWAASPWRISSERENQADSILLTTHRKHILGLASTASVTICLACVVFATVNLLRAGTYPVCCA